MSPVSAGHSWIPADIHALTDIRGRCIPVLNDAMQEPQLEKVSILWHTCLGLTSNHVETWAAFHKEAKPREHFGGNEMLVSIVASELNMAKSYCMLYRVERGGKSGRTLAGQPFSVR